MARLSVDRSGIGMNLAENLSRDYPQWCPRFSNESKERWPTDFKFLLQRRDVELPRDREMVSQIHSNKRRELPSGKVAFDAECTSRGHAGRFWAIFNSVIIHILCRAAGWLRRWKCSRRDSIQPWRR